MLRGLKTTPYFEHSFHSYLSLPPGENRPSTVKITPNVFNFLSFSKAEQKLDNSLHVRQFFGIWLRHQCNWYSMYMSRIILFKWVFKRNISHRYFNFLFELPNLKTSLICSYILSIYSLVTLEKVVLLKKIMYDGGIKKYIYIYIYIYI